MSVRRSLPTVLGAVTLILGLSTAAAPSAAADPCGFYETSSDAYYNHCTSDGSPGITWLGSAGEIDGAAYVGRTC
jgi:uncharacterized protein DUF6355